jgi:tetratricopeptide (TPR) repeat protein
LFLGLLATTLRRWDDAEAHFQEALAMNTRLGARPWFAHTGLGYAEMLLARNLPGDARKAWDLLVGSQPIAEELGLGSLTDRFRAARGRLEAIA